MNISITEVKASDPQASGSAGSAGGSAPVPKRKRSWALRELTVIDGRHLPSAATQATNSESGSIGKKANNRLDLHQVCTFRKILDFC